MFSMFLRQKLRPHRTENMRKYCFIFRPVDNDDDDDDEERINFSVALSPKTTRTRNNKPKQ